MLAGLVRAAYLRVAAVFSRHRMQQRRSGFRCPLSQDTVDATFIVDTTTGECVDVYRCSAFHNGRAVTCAKWCIQFRNEQRRLEKHEYV